ncbi:pyruvate dehydrogenase complex dihydrolipoamide acetyltransferase [Sphingosinicella sp. BN140058]|uniref:pyruvate dehydrogenase complex dihydrolipoamide acetyltransferase n=1 Tax=Sphingosinicella sp. BN140058 TaxID=1892855 RepID=UPI0010126DDC|nr:pyruvate dehydrogenase complex dihydrolipoamide acetyltransferase [Sphingosinicella sp. BN140058]QAY77687.1 pyruvate dehydrogenase complex dihydrolipoamide acetyltransferase [Sphingosinicella sp. BN140058]
MPIELKMPALSPTMEEGTLAKWLVKEGDTVAAGDLLAEIETDKATMEFEAVDEGTIAKILVAEGTDEVKVGTVIALIAAEGEDVSAASAPTAAAEPVAKGGGETGAGQPATPTPAPDVKGYGANPAEDKKIAAATSPSTAGGTVGSGDRVKASPLARRIAEQKGIDLAAVKGTGPGGRIVKVDIDGARPGQAAPAQATAPAAAAGAPQAPAQPAAPATIPDIPHEAVKLSNIRKTIARRLTESKQNVPHIYLTVDIQLDKLLKLRSELNAGLEGRGVKLSVNDMLIKALAAALMEVPSCNVMYTGTELVTFKRADISVAVSTPTGLITPIVAQADTKSLSAIATEIKELAGRAREGKLKPEEYQGGTASLSNMGMYGIKQFEAVINPPQGMIMAIGAGEKRPYVIDDSLQIATVMSATGSFDHRAIDGADGAQLMQAFKRLVENPLGMLA